MERLFVGSWLKLSSDQIAILSLVVAALSSLFATYQWWDSGRQDRIRAAIDISNKHLENPLNPELVNKKVAAGMIDFGEVAPKLVSFYARLEYAAYLANRGLADERYFSVVLTCDIVTMASEKDTLRNSDLQTLPATEAKKFASRQKAAMCPKPAAFP
jgi:hypothetical protein